MGAGASSSAEVAASIQSACPADLAMACQALSTEQRAKLQDALTQPSSPPSAIPTFPCLYPMKVMRYRVFSMQSALPRSDEAESKGLMETYDSDAPDDVTCIFISHSWWDRTSPGAAKPDYTTGDQAHLKFRVICEGVKQVIQREALNPEHVVLWMDYFSIDQDDEARKQEGVRSMVHYTSRASCMLIPVPTEQVATDDFVPGSDPEDCAAYYPEDVADYGGRGWCRVEFFIFSLYQEMRAAYDSALEGDGGPLRLFAIGSGGASSLQHFKTVEFLGGDRGDMPSQGAFSVESDRQSIQSLESLVISAFGHAALRCAAKAVAAGDFCVDLGAKMLRDEHLPTLRALVESGALKAATTLSFNAISSLTTLPDLTGLDALRTLTMVNCTGLRRLPDLGGLPSLQTVKLENCVKLEALPALRPGLEYDDNFLPQHLRSATAPPEAE